jgi:hypothetical protein
MKPEKGNLRPKFQDDMAHETMQCDELTGETGAHRILVLYDAVSWQYAHFRYQWNAPDYLALVIDT